MNLSDSILLAIVDKFLIAALILFFGFWLNTRLEKLKGQIALQNAVGPARGGAYAKLWALTEELSPRGPLEPPRDKYIQLFEALRGWYYTAGNAMYLSIDAADLFLQGLEVLEHPDRSESGQAKKIYSALRTQMKIDLGVYAPADARVQIPMAG
jgi:hypothetical protein